MQSNFKKYIYIVSPIPFEVGIPKFGLWMHLEMSECRILFWVTKISDFTSDSVKTIFQNMVMFHIKLKGMKYTTVYYSRNFVLTRIM